MRYDPNNDSNRLAFIGFIVFTLLIILFVAYKPVEQYKEFKANAPKEPLRTEPIQPLPPLPDAPKLINPEISVNDNQAINQILKWSPVKGATAYLVEVWIDETLVDRLQVEAVLETNFSWTEVFPGKYYYKVSAIDDLGRNGKKSETGLFEVKAVTQETPEFVQEFSRNIAAQEPEYAVDQILDNIILNRPPEIPPELLEKQRQIAAEQERIRREIASQELKVDETIIAQVDEKLDAEAEQKLSYQPLSNEYLDPFYNSNVQVLLGTFGLVSSTQSDAGVDGVPLASTATIKFQYQDTSSHGYEAQLKMKTLSMNDTAEAISPLLASAEYHHRWIHPVTWFNLPFLRRMSSSAFGGIEVYQNQQTLDNEGFLNSYNLLKVGSRLRFSVFDNFETGGELVYGFNPSDELWKLELQGYLDYIMEGSFIVGLGYRAHLLESRNSSKTPFNTSPYREAYAEAYGSLKYQF